jgi:cell division protein FtsL
VKADYSYKKKSKKIKINPLKLIICFFIGYMVFSYGQVYFQIRELDEKIASYEKIKEELLIENDELQDEYAKLHNDTFIEKMAREKLGMVKPGETIIIPAKPGKVIPLDKPESGEIMD